MVYEPCFCQQRGVQGSLSSHLRGGRHIAVFSSSPPGKEAPVGIPAVCAGLFRAGVFYRLVSGVSLGHSLVGLQRTCAESKRQDMSGWDSGLRFGRDGLNLPASAALREAVQKPFTKMAVMPVPFSTARVYCGCHLLCGPAEYRAGDQLRHILRLPLFRRQNEGMGSHNFLQNA